MLFEANGLRVVTADTCALGVRQAQNCRPDVCVLDLTLPDDAGVSFIAVDLGTRRTIGPSGEELHLTPLEHRIFSTCR
jgi:ActR/RegA family two-component response regulator